MYLKKINFNHRNSLKSELRDDLKDLANSIELRETIFSLVKQWVGTKITDFSSTISNFVDTTIRREFDFDQSFYNEVLKEGLDLEQSIPHVYVRAGGDRWFDCSKKHEQIELTFLKNFFGYPQPVKIDTFDINDFSTIRFENEKPIRLGELDTKNDGTNKQGELEIEVYGLSTDFSLSHIGNSSFTPSSMFSMTEIRSALSPTKETRVLIGTCKIPLSEAIKKDRIAQEWPIFSKTGKVGSISLVFTFNNQNLSTLKEKLSQLIVDKILDDIKRLQKNATAQASTQGIIDGKSSNYDVPEPFKYNYIPQTSTLDVEYFVEISSISRRKKHLELFYNHNKIGNVCSMLQTGPIKCPSVDSITKDTIEIHYTDEDVCKIEKIHVNSIPWESGGNLSLLNVPLQLELRSEIKSPSKEPISAADVVRKLLHVFYFESINAAATTSSKSNWNGCLGRDAKNILSMLRPCCSSNQWKAMVMWTLLGIRLLIPDISHKILYDHVKIMDEMKELNYSEEVYGFSLASNAPFAVQNYKKTCVEEIAKYHELDEHKTDDTEEMQCKIDNLLSMHHYDSNMTLCIKDIRTHLNPHVCKQIKEKIAETIKIESNPVQNIQSCLKLLESYESSLQNIQLKFVNFAVEVWCPVLALNIIDNILSRIVVLLNHIQSNESTNTKEIIENTIAVYLKIKSLFRYGQDSEFKKTKSTFFQIFEDWRSPWLDHIEKKGKEQISTAVHGLQRSGNDSPVKMPLVKKRSYDLGFLDEIEGAKQVQDIIQSIVHPSIGTKPWQDIFYPYHLKGELEENLNKKRTFLQMLHRLFIFYIELLEEVVLSDHEFDPLEMSNIMLSMFHVKYQYLDDFYVNEITENDTQGLYIDYVKLMQSEVAKKAMSIVDQFCSYQKKYFEMHLQKHNTATVPSDMYKSLNTDNTINGHIEGVLKFFRDKRDAYSNINQDHVDQEEKTNRIFVYLIHKLFQLQEEVIKEHFEKMQKKKRTSTDLSLYKQLLDTLDLTILHRRKEEIKESKILTNIYNEVEVKSSSTIKLISKYLGLVTEAQQSHQDGGSVRYIVGRVGSKIHVHFIICN